jgi:hypothetical protein
MALANHTEGDLMTAAAAPSQAQHRPRPGFLGLAVALFAAALFEAVSQGSWGAFAAGLVAPDLALPLGSGRGLAKGQLHPRAVPVYNAVHVFWGPAALLVAAVFLPGSAALVGGLAWATHVALDRGVGYTLRTRDGFLR